MAFSQMMELLQEKNKGKIVICNIGNFYVAIGANAVLLNDLIDLKVSCFKPEICKVGFPINALEKYTDLIQEKDYSYIVYYFNQQNEELEVLKEYKGKYTNEIKKENINCYICSKSVGKYKKADKYIIALSKLYEKEQEELEENKKMQKETEEKEDCVAKMINKDISKKEENERKRKLWFQRKNKKTN